MLTIKLFQEDCIGCSKCEEICPHQVFRITGRKAHIVDLHACMECGASSTNCPVAAINVDTGVGCASGLINEWLRKRKYGGFDLSLSHKYC